MQEVQETWVQSLGKEDPLEKEMATHSSILAWRIPQAEEPGGLHSSWDLRASDTAEQLSTTVVKDTYLFPPIWMQNLNAEAENAKGSLNASPQPQHSGGTLLLVSLGGRVSTACLVSWLAEPVVTHPRLGIGSQWGNVLFLLSQKKTCFSYYPRNPTRMGCHFLL